MTMEATVAAIHNKHTSQEETPLEALGLAICSVLVVGLFVLTFIFQNFEIPSSSMEKTLLVGDHVLVGRVNWRRPLRGRRSSTIGRSAAATLSSSSSRESRTSIW